MLVPSLSRMKVWLASLGITIPFVVATFAHPFGFKTLLYIGGPIASILAPLAYKRISYEKCAFWSSATLFVLRLVRNYADFDRFYTILPGSYLLLRLACLALAFVCLCVAAIRLIYFARASRLARKTFAA
jgi:hypothetical protein